MAAAVNPTSWIKDDQTYVPTPVPTMIPARMQALT